MEGLGICAGIETIENSFENKVYYLIGVALFLILPFVAILVLSITNVISV